MTKLPKVEMWTDGACTGNPGPGGWAAILRSGRHEKVLTGGERATTNNRMEITAALEGLRALKAPCQVVIYTIQSILCKARRSGCRTGKRVAGNVKVACF